MLDYSELAVPGIRNLAPYKPGKPIDELQREYGLSKVVKLASNENPLGPGPKAIAAVQSQLSELARYPDGNGFTLKKKLSENLQVRLNQITLGNGSNDLLEFAARTFAQAGEEIIFSQHAFAVYPLVTQAIDAKAVVVPAKNWGHNLEAMLAAITDKTRVIFIANPNNPTGTWLGETELADFLANAPERVIVVLDEAYFEYAVNPSMGATSYPDGMKFLAKYNNLIVSRTFSKAYGLAGLRVGYAVSSPVIADLLNRVRQPFNVNSLALAAACAALDDQGHIEKSVELNVKEMGVLKTAFSEMKLEFIPSVGNFICVDVGKDAAPVYLALLKKGVIVRPVANYEMPNHLRVTIGTRQENEMFLQALDEVLG